MLVSIRLEVEVVAIVIETTIVVYIVSMCDALVLVQVRMRRGHVDLRVDNVQVANRSVWSESLI